MATTTKTKKKTRKIESFFPTSVYSTKLLTPSSKLHKDVLEDCYLIQEKDDDGRAWSKSNYVGGYTSYSSYSELHLLNSTFHQLEKKIHEHVLAFAKELDMDLQGADTYMTDCWLNIMPARTAHSLHIHPLSFISGTYYVKTPRNCSGITFEDPRLPRFMAAPPKQAKAKISNKTHIELKPRAGDLVLFESWLGHEVKAAETEEERVSVSFNYGWG